MVKALKAFRVYILHSKIIAFVPSIVVKDVLLQPDIEGKRGRWIVKILEFDIEIRPTKLIKGQGLAHLMVDSNCKALSININAINEKTTDGIYEYPDILLSDWYKDIIYFLQNCSCPPEMEKSKRRAFKLKVVKYYLMDGNLYWKDLVGVLLKCVDEIESQRIMEEVHAGVCGGHLY